MTPDEITTSRPLRLMAVMAHPDDESLGIGGTLATYAARGVETYLVTATRGERGRYFTNEQRPSDDQVGLAREAELRAAARVLGVRELALLDYIDGELDRANPREAVGRIAAEIRRVRPHVVVTFDPFGAYGHPDHVAICQFTTSAVLAAAEASFRSADEPHAVSKLYYFVNDERHWKVYESAFKRLTSRVDGVERATVAWPEWAVSARIDTREHWRTAWQAIQCHATQLAVYGRLGELTPDEHETLWSSATFYRVFSRVNGSRVRESDLFAGLR